MFSMLGKHFLLSAGFVMVAAVAAGQTYLPQQVGRYAGWRFVATPSNIRGFRATPEELKSIEASARKLESLILAAPVLNPPRGFGFLMVGVLMEPDAYQVKARTAAGLPLDVWIRFGAPNYFERDGAPTLASETHQLDFFLNDVRPVILDHHIGRKWEDAQGDFYVEPPIAGEIGGFPVYKDMLVITRPGESIWAPVSVERLMRSWIPQLKSLAGTAERERERARQNLQVFRGPVEQEKRRKEIDAARKGANGDMEVRRLEFFFKQDEETILRKANPDPSRDQWYYGPVGALKAAESKMVSLNAAGKQAPACVTDGENPLRYKMNVVPAGTPGCRPVVQANLAILHRNVPRGALQVITLEGINYCRELLRTEVKQRTNPGDCTANLELVRQIDWKKVAALLAP